MPSEKTSGRHTPKGTARGVKGGRSATRPTPGSTNSTSAKPGSESSRAPGYASTGRYTPPLPPGERAGESPKWVAPLMFTLFIVGLLTIVLNLLEVLPEGPNNWYTLGGLAVILMGFVAATKLR